MTDEDDILATLAPSRPRAIFGLSVMATLGTLLWWTALAEPPQDMIWLAVLIGVGAAAFASAWRMWRLLDDRLVLTRTRLRTASGDELCRLSEVRSVERGVLAFKPSGGFLLRLHDRKPRAWRPGLWWRLGRSIGVGGITRAAEARTMADIIAMQIADKD